MIRIISILLLFSVSTYSQVIDWYPTYPSIYDTLTITYVTDTNGEYDIAYGEQNCNCENRDGVFFNIKLLIYLVSLSSILAGVLVFGLLSVGYIYRNYS